MLFAAPRSRVRLAIAVVALATLGGCTDRQLEPTGIPRTLTPHRTVTGTTITVTNTADAGTGSLRDAILNAPAGATIVFDPSIDGQTITLTSGELMIANPLTIEGSATKGMTISGGNNSRVLNFNGPSAGVVRMSNLTITGGTTSAEGGGIFNAMSLVLDHVMIAGNSAAFDGGGVYGFSHGSLTIANSTITANTAGSGGGLASFGNLLLNNVTIVANTASTVVGGFLADDDTPTDTHEVRNSIIAGNNSPTDLNCGYETQVTFTGVNISDDLSCGPAGPHMIVADPVLGALADNGGPTKTMAVLRGSPAIDAATDCTVNDDQRHVSRPLGAACDIGAYEFDNYVKTPLAVDGSVVVNSTTGVAVVTGNFGCSEPASVLLHVTLSEPQKVGKVPAVVTATDSVPITCTSGSKAWSIALTPPTGAFSNGNGSVTASTDHVSQYVLPVSTTVPVKLYWGHK